MRGLLLAGGEGRGAGCGDAGEEEVFQIGVGWEEAVAGVVVRKDVDQRAAGD
jgi:hypothetical protein